MGIIVQLSNVRLSYPKFGEPEYFKGQKQRPNDKRRWSAAFHVGPESMAQRVSEGKLTGTKQAAKPFIDAMLAELCNTMWEKKGPLKLANILPDPKGCCWQDGARKEVPGVWILSTHRAEEDNKPNKGRPLIFDTDLSHIYKRVETGKMIGSEPEYVITNEVAEGKAGRIYSGMYVNAQVELWAQREPEGLRGALLVVQRFKDGDAFSGGAAPNAAVMAEVEDGSDADDMS